MTGQDGEILLVNKGGCSDGLYNATMEIIELCKANNLSMAGIAYAKGADTKHPENIAFNVMCTVDSQALLQMLVDQAVNSMMETLGADDES